MIQKSLVAVFCLSIAAYGAADQRGLDVRPAGRELFEVAPREIVTTTFRITNSTNQRRLFISELELPQGWRLITEHFPFELEANESTTKLISFFVSETASEGRYKIKYIVKAREYPSIRDFYTIDVVVSGGIKEEQPSQIAPFVIAGQEYKVCFFVTNKSQTEDTISITVESSDNIPISIDEDQFMLGPGQSKVITVTIKPDANIKKNLKHRLLVNVQIGRDAKPENQSSVTHLIDIIPRQEDPSQKPLRTDSTSDSKSREKKDADKTISITLKEKDVEEGKNNGSKGNPKFILGPTDAIESLETEPRKILTTVLRVHNPTDIKQELIPEVKLPDGWTLITQDFAFELNPNETRAKMISIFVPQTTLAGRYELSYIIKNKKYPSTQDIYTIYVTVLAVSKLRTELLESPKLVIAGEKYKSSFLVTNQGNADYTIKINVDCSDNMPYTIDVEQLTLAPGKSRTVVINVETDAKSTKKINHYLQLTAEAIQEGKVTAQSKSASFVEIIPGVAEAEDRFHRIPTELILNYTSQNNNDSTSGFQTELRGAGTLDEEGTKHIKFRFAGPDIEDKSIFGQRDEYTLSHWTKDYELHLGDRTYSLSELTENYLFGRGIEGKLYIDDNFSLGAYYTKTRWLEPKTEETAAHINYAIDNENKIGLNYLRKLRDGTISNITSFEGELKPFDNIEVDLEYALEPDGTDKSNAYLTRLYGYGDWGRYYLKLTHAGPEYNGYYSDLDYISGGITLPVNKQLRVNSSFRREKNNLDSDPTFYSAPLEKYYQLGLDYRSQTDTTFSIDWLNRDRRDRLDSPKFDYDESTLRFGIIQTLDKLTIHASGEYGKTHNKLIDSTSDAQRYTASVYLRPNSRQQYNGYIYYDKNDDFTGENRRSTTFGMNTRYKVTNKTSCNFRMETNNNQGSTRGDRDNIEMGLQHTFTNGNELSLLVRHTRYIESNIKDDTAVWVQGRIPLGLPVRPKKNIGSIKGYIYDQETQKAIGRAIIRLSDSTVVTNNNGIFSFPSAKPGTHYLTVDPASIGIQRIPNLKTPIELTVEGGKRTEVTIPVTRAAWLSGRIMVYNDENNVNNTNLIRQNSTAYEPNYADVNSDNKNDILHADYGLADIIVEIRNGSEIKRNVTDEKGHFIIEGLRPGKWTIKIYANNLPEYHYLEKNDFTIELEPGHGTDIPIKVLPKKRRIQIIAEPKTLVEQKQE